MSSEFLNMIGLGGIDIGYILLGMAAVILILMILVIVQIAGNSKLKKKYAKFMRGKNAGSLEEDIANISQDMILLKTGVEKNKKDIRAIYKQLSTAFQKIGIVKYDAFNQMGGKLSFCLALLDEDNNGFIINSVHSTEGCYSYSKEIKNGKCKIDLGKEEQEALAMAMKSENE